MTHWDNNAIQFPRLLAEIMATQEKLDMPALAESMDISIDELNELFDRAHQAWELIKVGATPPIPVTLNGFDATGNVVSEETAQLTLDQITDIVDHAVQLIVVRRSNRRSSGDTEGPLNELEEALEASGILQTFESQTEGTQSA